MIVGRVACAVPGCTEPVVGQCPGFGGECGRFYCTLHDAGHLCPECARRRASEELYNRYMAACAQANPLWERWLFALVGAPVALCAGVVAAHLVSGTGAAVSLSALVTFGLTTAAVIILLAQVEARRVRQRVARLSAILPGFADFFKAWRKNRQREALMTTLVVGAAAVLGAVAASEERQPDLKP